MTEFGYAGNILKIDLSDGNINTLPTAAYSGRFLGGHGLAAKLYWDMAPPQAGAYDPENCLICASGPVAGFPRFAGYRWKICGKSVLGDLEAFNYCNLGERWGAYLKFNGYDALVVQGKADKPVIVFIHDGTVEIKSASHLWGKQTFDTIEQLKAEYGGDISVLTIGPAAENLVPYATLFADEGSSGSGGLGAVMASKNVKAMIIAPGKNRPQAANPERLKQLAGLIKNIVARPDRPSPWTAADFPRSHSCYGCGIGGCERKLYRLDTDRRYKALCEASIFYSSPTLKYYGKAGGPELLGTRLCDGYGIDTSVMHGMIEWIDACYKKGLLTEGQTGLPLAKIGSSEFIEALIGMIARREGFGEILARGTIATAREIGPEAEKLLPRYIATRGSETKDYDPRLMITTALLYATEPRRPIQQLHGVCFLIACWLGVDGGEPGKKFPIEKFRNTAAKFWGSTIAADFSTLEGKPLAAKIIQDRVFAKESLVLCDFHWPLVVATDRDGDPTLESQIYSAITGKETSEVELYKIGERIFNLQRAILLREGWQGRRDDRILDFHHTEPLQKGELFYDEHCLVPGKDGKVISKLGAVLDRADFEKLKDEYYELRGWDVASGLPTKAKLEELALGDIARDLEGRGLLG